MKKIGIVALAFLFLSACSVEEVPRNRLVEKALSLVGSPYKYGGTSPREGFDCSGLVYYVYRSQGLKVPRTAREQFRRGRRVGISRIKPGDLLFFRFHRGLHVGIFVGRGYMVHASPERGVVKERLVKYWKKHFLKGVSYL